MVLLFREYIIVSLKVLLFVGFAINIAHPRQIGVMRVVLGMILISAIMLPLVDIFDENRLEIDIGSLGEDNNGEINDDAIEYAFERGIERYICSEYNLREGEVRVMADGFDLSDMTAKKIYVVLSGSGIYIDYKRLRGYIAEEFTKGGVCEVELDIK